MGHFVQANAHFAAIQKTSAAAAAVALWPPPPTTLDCFTRCQPKSKCVPYARIKSQNVIFFSPLDQQTVQISPKPTGWYGRTGGTIQQRSVDGPESDVGNDDCVWPTRGGTFHIPLRAAVSKSAWTPQPPPLSSGPPSVTSTH